MSKGNCLPSNIVDMDLRSNLTGNKMILDFSFVFLVNCFVNNNYSMWYYNSQVLFLKNVNLLVFCCRQNGLLAKSGWIWHTKNHFSRFGKLVSGKSEWNLGKILGQKWGSVGWILTILGKIFGKVGKNGLKKMKNFWKFGKIEIFEIGWILAKDHRAGVLEGKFRSWGFSYTL